MNSLQEIIQDDSGSFRTYYIQKVGRFPSVNAVISAYEPKDGLIQWKQRVGFAAAESASKEASFRGDLLHKCNEKFLKKEPLPAVNVEVFRLFQQNLSILQQVQPLHVEQRIYWVDPDKGDRGFAGTPDLVAAVNDKIFWADKQKANPLFEGNSNAIFDYKTWNNPKYPESKNREGVSYFPLVKYWLQLSAYAGALSQRTGKLDFADKLFIVGTTIKRVSPMIYHLDAIAVGFYWNHFQKMLHCFYGGLPFDWKGMEAEAKEKGFLGTKVFN